MDFKYTIYMRYVFLQGKYNQKVSSSFISIANLIYFEQKDKNIWRMNVFLSVILRVILRSRYNCMNSTHAHVILVFLLIITKLRKLFTGFNQKIEIPLHIKGIHEIPQNNGQALFLYMLKRHCALFLSLQKKLIEMFQQSV